MLQIDEIENERFIRMSEIEFIEAIARCASCLPLTYTILQKNEKTDLPRKFEWMIHELKQKLCPEILRNSFQRTSIFE